MLRLVLVEIEACEGYPCSAPPESTLITPTEQPVKDPLNRPVVKRLIDLD